MPRYRGRNIGNTGPWHACIRLVMQVTPVRPHARYPHGPLHKDLMFRARRREGRLGHPHLLGGPRRGTLTRTGLALAAITACLVGGAVAQQPRQPLLRHGFWFSGGLGYGSLGCKDCDGRTGALSGNISLGGTLSQKLLLGVSTNGWTKSESGSSLTVAAVTAAVRFYPSTTGGFFLTGGLGLGTVSAGIGGFGSASQTGGAALLGLGYDIPIGRSVSLTPYWNGYPLTYSGAAPNAGQL